MSTTRRQLLGRGAGIVGAAAVPASLIPATAALAQASDETDALEPVVELEQAAELAYSLAAEDGDLKGDAQKQFELFAAHCGDHAVALSEALDQLGVDPPEAQSDPAEYEPLADFDPKAPEKQQLEFMIGLEEELITALPRVDAGRWRHPISCEPPRRSAPAHAQMLVALRVLAGEPEARLTELPLMEAKPPSDSRATLVRWMGIEDANHSGPGPRRRRDEALRRGRRDRSDPPLGLPRRDRRRWTG